MSVVKSDLIKELADNYPNFLRKDLTKLIDITISEMQNALKRGERKIWGNCQLDVVELSTRGETIT